MGKVARLVSGRTRFHGVGLSACGELAQKPRITVLNKVDALDAEERDYFQSELERVSGDRVLLMSGVSREGTDTVLRALRAQIDDTRLREKKSQEEPQKWEP